MKKQIQLFYIRLFERISNFLINSDHKNPQSSYAILAPQREGKFVDAKQATAAVVQTIQLDENDFRLGNTKARYQSNTKFIQFQSPLKYQLCS